MIWGILAFIGIMTELLISIFVTGKHCCPVKVPDDYYKV